MAEIIAKGIRTKRGNAKIDYDSLANLPKFDTSLSNTGQIADAKAVGEAINSVRTSVNDMSSEMTTFKEGVNTSIAGITSNFETFEEEIDTKINSLFTQETNEEDGSVTTTIQTLLDMNEHKITGLPEPEEDADAATKKYVDETVGGLFQQGEGEDPVTTMQTPINMGENKITGLPDPEDDADAATKKYVDDTVSSYVDGNHLYETVTLWKSDWSGDSVPFTQEIECVGILESDTPHWGIIYSDEFETKLLEKAAFALVDDLDTSENTLTFTCFKSKPGVDLHIQIEVNR